MKIQPLVYLSLIIAFLSINKQGYSQGFTVSGTRLLDANDKEFIIRGVNNPHVWYPRKSYKSLDRIAELNTNCVRIVWTTNGKVKHLDKALARCIELKMIPMIELHNATGDSTMVKLMELVSYFIMPEIKEVINKYEKYVLINIANEWGNYNTTSTFWKECYMEAIAMLRQYGYNQTLVIDAPCWGQNIDPIFEYGKFLLDYDSNHNLLFSVHMYYFWNDSVKIDTDLQKIYDASLPLIIGEFGYNYNNGNNNLSCKVNHQSVMRKCTELGYGYIPWSWTANDENNVWLDLTHSKNWNTLTWWGKEVYEGENGITNTAQKASVFQP